MMAVAFGPTCSGPGQPAEGRLGPRPTFEDPSARRYVPAMADVFLSYATVDRARALQIAIECNSLGYSVWWDRAGLVTGMTFQEEIQRQLQSARCVVVLWSLESVRSHWVLDEAKEGLNKLAPVLLDRGAKVPLGFGQIQVSDLSEWQPGLEHPEFENLILGIARLVGREPTGLCTRSSDNTPSVHTQTLPIATHAARSSSSIELIEIPAGTFTMGSVPPHGSREEHPQRRVAIARPFLLARTPITNA
jgi:hypothetical protein